MLKNILQEANAKQFKIENETTCRVFRTAYKICKKERPFSDLPTDIKLQQLNGSDMGRVLHTDHSCADIVTHIANEILLGTSLNYPGINTESFLTSLTFF